MNAAWNQFTPVQQSRFLQTTGLSELPAPSALTPEQISILTVIAGESAAQSLREAGAGALAAPSLIPPSFDTGDWSSIMAMVMELQAKGADMQIKAASEGVMAQKDAIKAANDLKMEKLQESINKAGKANALEIAGKVIGWAGVGLALVGAVAATIATKGMAAPLLALALVSLGVMVANETGAMDAMLDLCLSSPAMCIAAWGPIAGGALAILLATGVVEPEHVKMGFQVLVSVSLLAASVVAAVLTGGATAADTVLKVAGLVGQLTGGALSIAGGAVSTAEAVVNYDIATDKAEVAEMAAWLAKLQALMSEESESLQAVIEQLNGNVDQASRALEGIAQSHQSIIGNIGV